MKETSKFKDKQYMDRVPQQILINTIHTRTLKFKILN